MINRIHFDNLRYANQLTKSGVKYAKAHARALTDAFSQNSYTKTEVDGMLARAIREDRKKFDIAIREDRKKFDIAIKRFDRRTYRMKMEAKDEQIRFEKKMQQMEIESKNEQARFDKKMQQMELESKLEMKEANNRIDMITNRAIRQITLNLSVIFSIIASIMTAIVTMLHFIN